MVRNWITAVRTSATQYKIECVAIDLETKVFSCENFYGKGLETGYIAKINVDYLLR